MIKAESQITSLIIVGYFDDGTPLGSATNAECQIDSLPQSWAVLSHAGDPERRRRGLAALNARLVRRDLRVIQLFDPPFDHSDLEPGYVKPANTSIAGPVPFLGAGNNVQVALSTLSLAVLCMMAFV